MKIRRIGRKREGLRLDLTPLIDVVFLLLIFFMLGTSFIDINAGVKIELPKSTIEEISEYKEILIAIDKDKKMEIAYKDSENKRHKEEIKIENLEGKLKELLKESKEKNVIIKADKSIEHGLVVDIMSKSKNAGALSLDIAAEKEE
jgi:biopolymer transport protein ExbD